MKKKSEEIKKSKYLIVMKNMYLDSLTTDEEYPNNNFIFSVKFNSKLEWAKKYENSTIASQIRDNLIAIGFDPLKTHVIEYTGPDVWSVEDE